MKISDFIGVSAQTWPVWRTSHRLRYWLCPIHPCTTSKRLLLGTTWAVPATNLWQNCLWRLHLSHPGMHFFKACTTGLKILNLMFLKDWSCAPWTAVCVMLGTVLIGVPFGQVNTYVKSGFYLDRWTKQLCHLATYEETAMIGLPFGLSVKIWGVWCISSSQHCIPSFVGGCFTS